MSEPAFARLRGELEFRELPQGIVALAFDIGEAFEVDKLGREVLDAVRERVGISELVKQLADAYDARPDDVRRDLLAFLTDCADLGLVELSCQQS